MKKDEALLATTEAINLIDQHLGKDGAEPMPEELRPSLIFFRTLLVHYREALENGVSLESCHDIRRVIVDSWPLESALAGTLAQAEHKVETAMACSSCDPRKVEPPIIGGRRTAGDEDSGGHEE